VNEGHLPAPVEPIPAVFELRDVTDDEHYFSLGYWPTLAAAVAELDRCTEPDDLDSDGFHEDYCKVEIREHKFGWSGHGKIVYKRDWLLQLNKSRDDYEWVMRKL